jgi:hypothetical protein
MKLRRHHFVVLLVSILALTLSAGAARAAIPQPPLFVPVLQQIRDRLAAIRPDNPTLKRQISSLNFAGSATCAAAISQGLKSADACLNELQNVILDPQYITVNEAQAIVAYVLLNTHALYERRLTDPACTTPPPGQTASSTLCWQAGHHIATADAFYLRWFIEQRIGSLQRAIYAYRQAFGMLAT